MTELDITDSIKREDEFDKKLEEDTLKSIKQSEEEMGKTKASETKNLLIVGGMIIGLFIVLFGGFTWYNSITGSAVLTMEDLHQKNIDGELDNEEQGYIYNGFSFVKSDGLWWTEIQAGEELIMTPLHFAPKVLEEIQITGKLNENFNKGAKVYIAIDPLVKNPYYTLAVSELSLNLAQGIMRIPDAACTEEHYACEGRPIMSCDNNKGGNPIIELVLVKEGTKASVELKDSCIKIIGNNEDLVKGVDRVLYKWYKVMD